MTESPLVVVMPDNESFLADFRAWLDQRGLYLSDPVRITGEPAPDGELNRFIWPKSMRT